jgi:hypothetical protein
LNPQDKRPGFNREKVEKQAAEIQNHLSTNPEEEVEQK